MPPSRRATLFVVATIFIDAVGFGIVVPVLPRLIMRIGNTDLSGAIAIAAWMGLAMAIASFFAAPVIGNLSDRFGRRPVLIGALSLLAIDYAVMAASASLAMVFVARTISGAFGGSFGAAQAALADMTGPADRARAFGLVGAAFGSGFVLGPAIGGLLTDYGTAAPFIAAAALAAGNALYGLIVFPETLAPEHRRAFDWRRANPLGAWRAMRGVAGMSAVAGVLILWQIASLVYPLTWSFWAIARFGWDDRTIGLSLAGVGIVMALSQTFITGPAVKRLGERRAAMVGIGIAGLGFLSYANITQSWMAFALFPLFALQSLAQPGLMAMLSRRATAATQGETQGVAAMAMGIGSIVAPLLLTRTMAHFTGPDAGVYLPGAAFYVAAAFALAALIALRLVPRSDAAVEGLQPGVAERAQ